MKQLKIILGLILFASVSTFAQSPRIKLNQITKDNASGSVLISSPTDSGMVYSRDFFINFGADTTLVLFGDTIAGVGGGFGSILSDGVTITGDGTTGNELKVDTATVISTIQGLVDSLLNYVTLAGTQTITGAKTFTSDLNVDGKIALNDGGNSVFIGDGAGRIDDTTTNENVGIGYQPLYDNTSGARNIAIGYQALYKNSSASFNQGFGYAALYNNQTGNSNIAHGSRALFNLSSGNDNQAYGYEAGRYYGSLSNVLTNASNSLFIGSNTRASANGNSNEIVIGSAAIGNGTNTITIGSSSTLSLHTRNYEFDIDQTVSASEDNYVLTYDSLDGQISLEPIALSGSATLDFGSTSAQNSSDLTITVTGAADGDVVSLGVPNASVNANTNYTAWVSAANTVTVRFNNYSSGAVDPASGTFKVKIFK